MPLGIRQLIDNWVIWRQLETIPHCLARRRLHAAAMVSGRGCTRISDEQHSGIRPTAPSITTMSKAFGGLRAVALIEAAKGMLGRRSRLMVGCWVATCNPFPKRRSSFHMNPARHDPQIFVETLRDFADAHKVVLSFGAICYASARFVEAYGLWHAQAWAGASEYSWSAVHSTGAL